MTKMDREFLGSRTVCCSGKCSCASGKRMVNCFRQPCHASEKGPCKEAVRCEDNYCGGCRAEWFNKVGKPACSKYPLLYI